MENLLLSKNFFPEKFLGKTADYILSVQQDNGCIPWFSGGKTDPWDHTEAAMGLSIAGEYEAAEKAYQWLQRMQLEDGSWYAAYLDGKALKSDYRETNFVAYIATGVWHHYLVTGRSDFLKRCWPMVRRAVTFVLNHQATSGEIYWAVDGTGKSLKDALLTGCCSIYKSLECAINIATILHQHQNASLWCDAYNRLGNTIRRHPERFDRTWESKARFSMDWFYPVLTGIYCADEAKNRIDEHWETFVKTNMGCLCVSDEPWVAVAESCELTMALLAVGKHARAIRLYSWLHQWRDSEDGAYWTGYQYVENILWPKEKTTWTAGAILLAADAITEHTGAARLFLDSYLLPQLQVTRSTEKVKTRKV